MLRSGFIWDEDSIPEIDRVLIRNVLMNDWDPIGVNGIPEAANEYDNYIPKIYKLLTTNVSVDEVCKYLFMVVDEFMGLSPPITLQNMQVAAYALKKLDLGSN